MIPRPTLERDIGNATKTADRTQLVSSNPEALINNSFAKTPGFTPEVLTTAEPTTHTDELTTTNMEDSTS
jgi:hypothetical protein